MFKCVFRIAKYPGFTREVALCRKIFAFQVGRIRNFPKTRSSGREGLVPTSNVTPSVRLEAVVFDPLYNSYNRPKIFWIHSGPANSCLPFFLHSLSLLGRRTTRWQWGSTQWTRAEVNRRLSGRARRGSDRQPCWLRDLYIRVLAAPWHLSVLRDRNRSFP